MSLANQLSGMRLVYEGLRERFKVVDSDVEAQPPSPPRTTPIFDGESIAQENNHFSWIEAKIKLEHMPMIGP